MIAPPPAPWFFAGQFTVGNVLFIIWVRESPYDVRITELRDKIKEIKEIKEKSQTTRCKMAMSYMKTATGFEFEFMEYQDTGRSRHKVDRSTKKMELFQTVINVKMMKLLL